VPWFSGHSGNVACRHAPLQSILVMFSHFGVLSSLWLKRRRRFGLTGPALSTRPKSLAARGVIVSFRSRDVCSAVLLSFHSEQTLCVAE
jgi:hypothetical protein